jgi:transcription initiation factor IIE alpha subunit
MGNPRCKVNAMSIALMIRALIDDEVTQHDLSALTGLHVVTIRRYVKAMERAGAVHVCSWDEDRRGRRVVPVYKIGPGKTAARVRMDRKIIRARYKAKQEALRMMQSFAGPLHEVTHE